MSILIVCDLTESAYLTYKPIMGCDYAREHILLHHEAVVARKQGSNKYRNLSS